MKKDISASIRARLLNLAKAEGSEFNNVLIRFALERFLYRLSKSEYHEHFLLKGALLFTLWYDMPHRPTRDADLLGYGPSDLGTLEATFRAIAVVEADDGLVFYSDSVQAVEIRKEAGYAGARVTLIAELAGAKCKTQIDIGFGDAVTPAPIEVVFPVLLSEMPAPELRTYPFYTVISEKLHAITLLGITNSRLKDYYDLYTLIEKEEIDSDTLASALAATFDRRGMKMQELLPVGLTIEFANDPTRQKLWSAFLSKNSLDNLSLHLVVKTIAAQFSCAWSRAIDFSNFSSGK